jgi:cytochrome P450
VLALLRNRDQWELLRERPDATETAVEELLRYDTPGPVLQRPVNEELSIEGARLARGERVLLVLAAANRDPAAFAEPDRLDIERSPNPHLGFGHDAHYCLGAALARLETEVAIRVLVRRVPHARLAVREPEWEDSFAARGLKSLPLELGA